MTFAIDLVNTNAIVGLIGLILAPLGLVLLGLAYYQAKTSGAWRETAEAERAGREALLGRLESANEWNAAVEKRDAALKAIVVEKDAQLLALADRIDSQKEHLDKLLERTPEKLWSALERHNALAAGAFEQIVERLDTLLEEVRKNESAEKKVE